LKGDEVLRGAALHQSAKTGGLVLGPGLGPEGPFARGFPGGLREGGAALRHGGEAARAFAHGAEQLGHLIHRALRALGRRPQDRSGARLDGVHGQSGGANRLLGCLPGLLLGGLGRGAFGPGDAANFTLHSFGGLTGLLLGGLRRGAFRPGEAANLTLRGFSRLLTRRLLLALATGLGALHFGFVAAGRGDFGAIGLDPLGHGPDLLVAQRLLHLGQQRGLLVLEVLLEGGLQLGDLGEERLAVLGRLLEPVEQRLQLRRPFAALGDDRLRPGVLPQGRDQMVVLQPRQQLDLFLELLEQALARLRGAWRRLGELGEKGVGLGGVGLERLERDHGEVLGRLP
jgi:hypothetical protein